MLAGARETFPEATSAGWDGTAVFNGHIRTVGYHQNGARPAVATAEIGEQQELLRQLQHGLHELQTRLLQDQQHLGSATSALQVTCISLQQQLRASPVRHTLPCTECITIMGGGS